MSAFLTVNDLFSTVAIREENNFEVTIDYIGQEMKNRVL